MIPMRYLADETNKVKGNNLVFPSQCYTISVFLLQCFPATVFYHYMLSFHSIPCMLTLPIQPGNVVLILT